LAVIGVLLFHCNKQWMPAGFVGVDIFFVISGFVITGSLLRQDPVPETIGEYLGGFYTRRMTRLAPALFLVI
jgi:peptidoglycan/LPS O-acetylase OafA/YrhL